MRSKRLDRVCSSQEGLVCWSFHTAPGLQLHQSPVPSECTTLGLAPLGCRRTVRRKTLISSRSRRRGKRGLPRRAQSKSQRNGMVPSPTTAHANPRACFETNNGAGECFQPPRTRFPSPGDCATLHPFRPRSSNVVRPPLFAGEHCRDSSAQRNGRICTP
jgi:hypothetical protein